MKKTLSIIGLFLLFIVQIWAQQAPISAKIMSIAPDQFPEVNLFSAKVARTERAATLNKFVSKFDLFEVDDIALSKIAANELSKLEINLPLNGNQVTLQLIKSKIIDEKTTFISQDGFKREIVKYNPGAHYCGIVKNNPNTLVAISFFDDNVIGVISSDQGNYVLGKSNMSDSRSTEYILYNQNDLLEKPATFCETEDTPVTLPLNPGAPMVAGNCVRVYFEADNQLYVNQGSNVNNVLNYVLGIFNVTSTLYRNESINTLISQILVWVTADPYVSGTNTATTLTLFQTQMAGGFNGDLAHLLSARNLGGGRASGFGVLCGATNLRTAVSGNIAGTTPAFPTYSWNAYVVTHEMGHCLGSRHTHACVWNGNNTAIDGCAGSTEGGCAVPAIPAGGGTIMSYCHTQTVGINFNLGFGAQPGNVIRNHVNSSTCLTLCCQSNVNITGTYYIPLTESSTWIKSIGQTSVLGTASIKLDANPTSGFVELDPVTNSDFFLAQPTSSTGVFVAQALDGCGNAVPRIILDVPASDEQDISKTKLSPNPSAGLFNLDMDLKTSKNIEITIYNTLGQVVYAHDFGQVAELHIPINISDQKNGLYLLRIQSGSEVETRQIVLNK